MSNQPPMPPSLGPLLAPQAKANAKAAKAYAKATSMSWRASTTASASATSCRPTSPYVLASSAPTSSQGSGFGDILAAIGFLVAVAIVITALVFGYKWLSGAETNSEFCMTMANKQVGALNAASDEWGRVYHACMDAN